MTKKYPPQTIEGRFIVPLLAGVTGDGIQWGGIGRFLPGLELSCGKLVDTPGRDD
jgi:hypothetical protein